MKMAEQRDRAHYSVGLFIVLLLVGFGVSLILPRFRVEGMKESRVSWYGGNFHGRRAASGQLYNMLDLTAAHCARPLGGWLRITNLDNNSSVIVRITDRGPYQVDRDGRVVRPLQPHPRREVDLSYSAARKLGLLRSGVAKARIEYLVKY